MKFIHTLAIVTLAFSFAGCSTTQLQTAQKDITTIGDVIGEDAPTIINDLQASGALSGSKAAQTLAGLQTLQTLIQAQQGLNVTSTQAFITSVPAVDTTVASTFFPGTVTSNDVALANNLLALATTTVQQLQAANASPTPTP